MLSCSLLSISFNDSICSRTNRNRSNAKTKPSLRGMHTYILLIIIMYCSLTEKRQQGTDAMKSVRRGSSAVSSLLSTFVVVVWLGSTSVGWVGTAESARPPSSSSSSRSSSALLHLHRQYVRHPPHDTTLYDVLHVSPNATAAEIQKSYRTLSRRLHPDKQKRQQSHPHQSNNNNNISNNNKILLERVRQAYEVLNNDRTRLPYHRHGLIRANDVVQVLTGKRSGVGGTTASATATTISGGTEEEDSAALNELLRLMGFDTSPTTTVFSTNQHLPSTTATTTNNNNNVLNYYYFNSEEDNVLGIHRGGQEERSPYSTNNGPTTTRMGITTTQQKDKEERDLRVQRIALDLVERMRPVLEYSGTSSSSSSSNTHSRVAVSQITPTPLDAFVMNALVQQCDRLKRLPLGASILRCIGRAYRVRGRRYLARFRTCSSSNIGDDTNPQPISFDGSFQYNNHGRRPYQSGDFAEAELPNNNERFSRTRRQKHPFRWLDVHDSLHDRFRRFGHLASAAVAGGRAVWKEHSISKIQQRQHQRNAPGVTITTTTAAAHFDSHDEDGHSELEASVDGNLEPPTDDDIRDSEQLKAELAFLESLQVEALWKICKIDLDQIVQDACDLILEGDYFFFPSHSFLSSERFVPDGSSSVRQSSSRSSDGWVGSSGMAVNTHDAKLRVASLLVRMGNVMVQRSKDGTAWME